MDITDTAQAIIVTNRKLLYDKFDKTQVTSFLTYLSEVADGNSTGEVSAVIYYADWHSDPVKNWDNTQVQYPSPPIQRRPTLSRTSSMGSLPAGRTSWTLTIS